jgi:hypothetical protein
MINEAGSTVYLGRCFPAGVNKLEFAAVAGTTFPTRAGTLVTAAADIFI